MSRETISISEAVKDHNIVIGFLIWWVGALSFVVAGLVVAMLFVWRALP